tara:strand:+ start:5594 stop:6067 length:474 start_codon:yes stop_codon:yes gene_type:complete
MRIIASLLLVLMMAFPAFALVAPSERLDDPALEARARTLSKELRCLVCQNQSIDDSDAELAGDLRRLVRERLVAGDTNEEVLDYIVARYGEFVLMTPRFEPATWGLWLGPLFVLLAGGGLAVLMLRRNRARAVEARLSTGEEARVAALMTEDDPPRS